MTDPLTRFQSPYERFRDKYLNYDLSLDTAREDPFAIVRMLDEVATVYDYYSELAAVTEDRYDDLTEAFTSLESQFRELVQGHLEHERIFLNDKKGPTLNDIKARFDVVFTQFRNIDPSPEEKVRIKIFYKDYVLKWVLLPGSKEDIDKVLQDNYAEDLYNKLCEYITLRKSLKESKRRDALLKNKVRSIQMRKDTLITQSAIIRIMLEKNVPLAREVHEKSTVPETELDTSFNTQPKL